MDVAELSRRFETYEGWVPPVTARVLIDLGHTEELRRLGAAGDWCCASAWAMWAAEHDLADEASAMLAPYTATGWPTAVRETIRVLAVAGRCADAVALVSRSGFEEVEAAVLLAELHAAQGNRVEAFELLRPYAGHWRTSRPWADLAAALGRDTEATEALAAGVAADLHTDRDAAIEVLLPFTTAEEPHAVIECAETLTRAGRLDEAVAILTGAARQQGGQAYSALPALCRLLRDHDWLDEAFAAIDDIVEQCAGDVTHSLLKVRADVLADKAYSSRAIRAHLRPRHVTAVIPTPADQAGHRRRRGSADGHPANRKLTPRPPFTPRPIQGDNPPSIHCQEPSTAEGSVDAGIHPIGRAASTLRRAAHPSRASRGGDRRGPQDRALSRALAELPVRTDGRRSPPER